MRPKRGCGAGPRYHARLLGVLEMPKVSTRLEVDISSIVGSVIFLWLIQARAICGARARARHI